MNGNKSALQAKFCTEGMNRTYTEFLKFRYNMHRNYRRWKSGRQRRDSVAIGEVIIAGGEDEVKHLCVFLVYEAKKKEKQWGMGKEEWDHRPEHFLL